MEYSGALLLLCLLLGQGAGELGIRVALAFHFYVALNVGQPLERGLDVRVGRIETCSQSNLCLTLLVVLHPAEQASVLVAPSCIPRIEAQRSLKRLFRLDGVRIEKMSIPVWPSAGNQPGFTNGLAVSTPGHLVSNEQDGHGYRENNQAGLNGAFQRNLLRRGSSGYGQVLLGVKD